MASLEGDADFSSLVAWSTQQGGRLHDAVEVYRDDVTQVSLRVRPQPQQGQPDARGLESGDTVVQCPLSTSLSYLNALADGQPLARIDRIDAPATAAAAAAASTRLTLPDAFLEQMPPHVVGRFFLMQQHLLGPSSHWFRYLATLPQPDKVSSWVLPALWPLQEEGERRRAPRFLAGTNAGVAAAEMRENVEREFEQAQALLKNLSFEPRAEFSRRLYHWAFCIFTSRSFRPSLVLGTDVQRILCRGKKKEGEEEEEEEEEEEGPRFGLPQLPDSCQMDDFSILLPVLDLANHDPTAKATWVAAAVEAAAVETTAAAETTAVAATAATKTTAAATSPVPGVSFLVDQPYAPGQQVFNNYGMKTNSELLLGYGFVLPPTPTLHNDYVHLRKRSDKTQTGPATDDQPRDFLLSLRSLDDASSVVGAVRQWRQRRRPNTGGDGHRDDNAADPAAILPEFAIFEDALLWDLGSQLWSYEEWQALGRCRGTLDTVPVGERAALLERVLSAAAAEDDSLQITVMEENMRDILMCKVGMDYERLGDTDGDAYDDDEDEYEDDEEEAQQKLARTYREQYRAVLAHAMTLLDPELEVETREGSTSTSTSSGE